MIFKVIEPLFKANTTEGVRTFVNQGGTSSGKTYTLMQVLIYFALVDNGCVITIAGQDLPNLKVGAMRDAKTIINNNDWLRNYFKFNESSSFFQGLNGSIIEFKSYQNEQDAKNGKRDYLFLNEANGVSFAIFWQLSIRTRKKVYIDYNPSERFWAHNELIGREGVKLIISDHRGNPFLTKEEHERIENIEDEELHKVYARGLTGKLSGVIFPNFAIVDELPNNDEWKLFGFGLDFGFTNDPTALVKVVLAHGELYVDLLIYDTGLTNPKIAEKAKAEGVTRKTQIVADSAEPKSIAELNNLGLWVVPTLKGKDSILLGIDILQRYKINVTRRSTALIEELQSYKWEENKDGKKTNKPIDDFNHAIDALRYFAIMKLNVRRRSSPKAHYNRLD
jgi:phage terminase large subunit|nr:MAG TPA: terminase large subunit [Caudoviricetes sp.]